MAYRKKKLPSVAAYFTLGGLILLIIFDMRQPRCRGEHIVSSTSYRTVCVLLCLLHSLTFPFMFYLPKFTLTCFYFISSQAPLPFLSCFHRTTTTTTYFTRGFFFLSLPVERTNQLISPVINNKRILRVFITNVRCQKEK